MRSVRTPDDAAELQTVVRRLIADLSDGERINGIGIAGMAETGVPLDRELQPLTKLITWREQPGVEQAEHLREELGPQELYARTGLRLSPKLPVITWRWLRDTQPDLLAYGGLDRLPPIAEPTTVAATTKTGIPVVLCGHDHLVGAWAAGVRQPGQVANSLGTSEAVITPSQAPVLDDVLRQQGISTGWYVDGRHGCAISGNGAAGGLVEQRLAALNRDYAWLHDVLNNLQPSEQVIAPYPQGRQAPAPDPTPTYDVTRPADDPAEEMRALVDALTFHARWMVEEQTRHLGIEWRSTVAFGGPTRLKGWMDRKARASGPGRDFAVLHGEATAAEGAALMAAEVVTGEPVKPLAATPIEVRPQLAEAWDSQFWYRFHKVVSRTT